MAGQEQTRMEKYDRKNSRWRENTLSRWLGAAGNQPRGGFLVWRANRPYGIGTQFPYPRGIESRTGHIPRSIVTTHQADQYATPRIGWANGGFEETIQQALAWDNRPAASARIRTTSASRIHQERHGTIRLMAKEDGRLAWTAYSWNPDETEWYGSSTGALRGKEKEVEGRSYASS